MPIEQKDGATVITGANSIQLYRLICLKHALRLEIKSLALFKKRAGRTNVHLLLKTMYGFKGNREAVLKQLEDYIAEHYPTPESAQ
jgi:hypothetical protein